MTRKNLFLAVPLVLIPLLAIGLIAGLLPSAPAESASPARDLQGITIPYAGRLTDTTGQPVGDGAYDFAFTLYPDEKAGAALWSETQAGVAVQGGNFSTLLGRSVAIPKEVAESGDLWLAVAVRGPAESAFSALDMRQRVRAAVTSPDLPSSCDHDHIGEWWEGSSSQAGLIVDNRTGSGDGVRGYATASGANYGGVYGVNFAAGPGVYGRSDGGGPGVAGYSGGRGVYGNGADGVVGESNTNGMSGVYGNNTATAGYGVTGRAESYFGVLAWGDDSSAYDTDGDLLLQGSYGEIFASGNLVDLYSNGYVVVDLDNDNNGSDCFNILNGTDGILWSMCESKGPLSWGPPASVARTADYGDRAFYSLQSPAVWLEDYGTAVLVGGEVSVAIDPVFAQAANTQQAYHVYVTALSEEPVLLYVSAKAPSGFTARGVTLDGRPANCSFDYRIVAQRLGYEGTRLEESSLAGSPKGER